MEAIVCISVKNDILVNLLSEKIKGITLHLTHAVCCSWLEAACMCEQRLPLL